MLSTLYNMRLKNVAVLVFMMLVLFFIICWVLQPQDISSISKRDFLLRKVSSYVYFVYHFFLLI